MRLLCFILAVAYTAMPLCAQEKENEFKSSGKPVVKVFTDWHQGMGSQDFEKESGFALTRAVLGYQYQFTPNISSKVVVDMDDPGSGTLTEVAYLRNAYIAYDNDQLNVCFGVIGMMQFKEQEKNWGYRYVYKSAMDYYKFNNSTDLGIYARYKFLDWLSADVTITNGEGAKKQQDIEGKYRTGVGLFLTPFDGFLCRTYYDVLYASESTPGITYKNQSTLALFLGYKTEKYRVGVEYDLLYNYKFEGTDDRDIISCYASYAFAKKFQAFGRYDYLHAEVEGKTEYTMMIGVDYQVIKGVRVSPNYRYGDYNFKGVLGEGSYFYLNLEYKF